MKKHPRIKQLLTLANKKNRFENIALDRVGFDRDTGRALDKAVQACTYWGNTCVAIKQQLVWLEEYC